MKCKPSSFLILIIFITILLRCQYPPHPPMIYYGAERGFASYEKEDEAEYPFGDD